MNIYRIFIFLFIAYSHLFSTSAPFMFRFILIYGLLLGRIYFVLMSLVVSLQYRKKKKKPERGFPYKYHAVTVTRMGIHHLALFHNHSISSSPPQFLNMLSSFSTILCLLLTPVSVFFFLSFFYKQQ